MKIQLLSTAGAIMLMVSATALAHPGQHDGDEEKAIPTTCAQLADTQRYTDDTAYPEVKTLKERCDAQAAKPSSAPAAQPARKAPEQKD